MPIYAGYAFQASSLYLTPANHAFRDFALDGSGYSYYSSGQSFVLSLPCFKVTVKQARLGTFQRQLTKGDERLSNHPSGQGVGSHACSWMAWNHPND